MKRIFILLLMASGLCSCVSMASYRDVKARQVALEYEKAVLEKANTATDTVKTYINTIENGAL
ncbi:MAG: hypothetical protein RSD75_02125 [Mucinivorans sp.]